MSFKRWETAAAKRAHRKAQAKYQKDPEQVEKRVNRNKARRHAIADGKVHKGDGYDINHSDGNAKNNNPMNWRKQKRHDNRSFPRNKDGSKKNPND